jgi:hypothetical protein
MSGSTRDASFGSGSAAVVSAPSSSSGASRSDASLGTRDPAQTPFASDSVFNLPIGSGAQWQANDQLANANIYINTIGNYNENIYSSADSDPVVTVTNDAADGGEPGSFQLHIPADAVPAGGSDASLTIDDTSTHTWYSFGGFRWTGSNSATVNQGSGEPDDGSGLTVASSNWDQGVGTLRENDLQAGTIDHMLRIQMPTGMLASYSNSVTQLAPYAWPQTQEDGFAVNGNGGTPYSGTIPFGVTIGIPADAVEPAEVAANAGADILWHALQNHGAMIRDSTGGGGNTVTLQADQTVDPNDPLIQGMEQFGSQIMASTKILINQGPDSVNGGGTPIVGTDPPVSHASDTASSSAPPSASSTNDGDGGTNPVTSSSNVTTATTGSTMATNAAQSDVATITPDTLSSGESASANASGMTFLASPTPNDTAASTADATSDRSVNSLGTNPIAASDINSTVGSSTATSSDFTPPTASSSSVFDQQDSTSGAGQSAWWASQQTDPNIPIHQV